MSHPDPFVQHILSRLSSVWYRTVPEIRPDLPDLPWYQLSYEQAEDFGRTYRALRQLIARGDVVVRLRALNDTQSNAPYSFHTTRRRQEFKLATPSGGKRSRQRFQSIVRLNPLGGYA